MPSYWKCLPDTPGGGEMLLGNTGKAWRNSQYVESRAGRGSYDTCT